MHKMSDERSDLILNMLRAIRAEQAAQREKLDEIISRLGRLEREVAGLHRELAGLHDDYAGLSVRLDNLDRRVGRIEARLELVDLPAPEPI
jgi:predicted nuclease with TOPRIM domain